jgi:hypothetical protein
MAPLLSYLVVVICCILLSTNSVSSFILPEFALRYKSNPSPDVVGPFLERRNVLSEDTEEIVNDLDDEVSNRAATTTRAPRPASSSQSSIIAQSSTSACVSASSVVVQSSSIQQIPTTVPISSTLISSATMKTSMAPSSQSVSIPIPTTNIQFQSSSTTARAPSKLSISGIKTNPAPSTATQVTLSEISELLRVLDAALD